MNRAVCLTVLVISAPLVLLRPAAAQLPPLEGPPAPQDAPVSAQRLDQLIAARLAADSISPAPIATDEVLIRRLSLDLIGRPATPKEIEAFRTDRSPARRQRLVHRLMKSPEFNRHQAAQFNTFLMGANKGSLTDYLEKAFAQRRAWDEIFRDLVLAEQEEALAFLKSRVSDLDKLTNDASVVFFGVNISCAKCHDHPFVPDWTQDRFFGMKSFFNRTFDHGDWVGERGYGGVEFKTTEGESKHASLMFFTGEVIDEPEVAPPDDKKKKEEKKKLEELKKKKLPAPSPAYSRREALVDIALSESNEIYLAKAIVNRLWHRLFGRGLVDPIDQMHPESAPSHPELLQWLAQDLVDHDFNLRRTIETMVISDTYARSSRWTGEGSRPSPDAFAVGSVRPLTPLQYAFTLKLAATSPEHFDVDPEEHDKRVEQLFGSARGLASNFEMPGEGFQVSVMEALFMSNNARIETDLLRDHSSSLIKYLMSLESNEQRALTALTQIFGHPPEADQVQAVSQYLTERRDEAQAVQQAVWAMLCSSACRFNY